MKSLDPNDDEEVFYKAFSRWLEQTGDAMFTRYDEDRSERLEAREMMAVFDDLGASIGESRSAQS